MNDLEELRKEIDKVDHSIIALLASRKSLTESVGKIKANNELVIEDKDREMTLLAKLKEEAEKKNIEKEMIEELYEIVFKYSKRSQNEIKQ